MTDAADAPTVADALAPEAGDMSVFDMYETDTTDEENGRWFNNYFGERAQGDIKIRAFASKPSIAVRRRLEALYRRHMLPDGSYPQDVSQKMVTEQLSQAIIVDWRGNAFRGKDGQPIPFSVDAAKKLLEKMPHFRNRIVQSAAEMDNFRAVAQDQIVKN